MVKLLSKSVIIMFIWDFIAFCFITSYWCNFFELPQLLCHFIVFFNIIFGITTFFLKGHYRVREFNINKKNLYILFEGILFTFIPSIILLIMFERNINSVYFLAFNFLSIYIAMLIYRILFHFYLFKFKKVKNVLIIGTGENAKLIADEIMNKFALRMNISGFYEYGETQDEYILSANSKLFKSSEDLEQIIKDNKIDIIVISITDRMEESFLTKMVFAIPRHVKIYKMAEIYEMVTGKLYIDKMTVNWLFYDFMNKRSLHYNFQKRTFDIIAALIILILTCPILIYVGIRVKLTDGGSPLYTQTRIGRNGKPFKCYKLRTMYKNDYVPKDVKEGGYADSQDEDDRVIPFCKFVRKARFDEIPQMINILKGDLSIVGPRTEWEDLVKIYSEQIPYYNCRMWIKTGWTGWAQINQGHCISNDDIAEKLQYDLFYLKHRNLLWEISILIEAVFLALGGRHG